jgi:hypothetical protein
VPLDLPTFDELDPATALTAAIVVLHDPHQDDTGRARWLLSLVDLTGAPIARETLAVGPAQRAATVLAQRRLHAIGRRVDGDWVVFHDTVGRAKHCARITPWLS